MRISATIIVILISTYIVGASVLDPVIENVVHLRASEPPKGVGGMWKKKTIWKPRWIKEWKSAKVMKPVWKKIWSPVQIREWVPIPKPPPGWNSVSTPLSLVHPRPKTTVKDLAGYGSFPVQATSHIPLWDPVPYPESQQPPPPPPAYPDNIHSATFNEEQITGIIGARYNTNEYSQEYSETTNHLTRLPVASNWRPPQPLPDFQNFPPLPEFLIPPQYQTLLENNSRFQERRNRPEVAAQKSIGKWIPLPPKNTDKAPDAPYRFQIPEKPPGNGTRQLSPVADANSKEKQNSKSRDVSDSFRHHADGELIQEAQLVGEFHYSEFDLTRKSEQGKNEKNNSSGQNEHIARNKEAEEKNRPTRTETKPEKTLLKSIPNEIYPVYENPHLFFTPPNHRFAPLDENIAVTAVNETSTKLHTVTPTQSAPEESFYKNASLQIVYPTAPQTAADALYKTYSYNVTAEDQQSTTESQSTPFSIVFPSSLEEEVTKSPVFIVTPAKTDSP